MHFLPIQKKFIQKYDRNKKKSNFRPQGLQIAAFQQSFSQCWWKRPIFEGSLIKKPTLTMIYAQRFFFPE